MPLTQIDKAQIDKARQFRALHEAPEAFVVANVWDGGSARMMASLGFAALATSSGASAGLFGRRDGRVTAMPPIFPSLPTLGRVSGTRPRLWLRRSATRHWPRRG